MIPGDKQELSREWVWFCCLNQCINARFSWNVIIHVFYSKTWVLHESISFHLLHKNFCSFDAINNNSSSRKTLAESLLEQRMTSTCFSAVVLIV